jgi:hypothetical protein
MMTDFENPAEALASARTMRGDVRRIGCIVVRLV